MCIIIHKESKAELPDETSLMNLWLVNSDGGGYAIIRGKETTVSKGYMKFDDLMTNLHVDAAPDDEVIIHFRLATHGAIDQGNTHPFPITNNVKTLRALDYRARSVFFHNGIFPDVWKTKLLSDTGMFVKEVLSKLPLYGTDSVLKLLAKSTHSRFLLVREGQVSRFGKWHEEDGIYYSNDWYKYSWCSSDKYQYGCGLHEGYYGSYACPACGQYGGSANNGAMCMCPDCGTIWDPDDYFYETYEEDKWKTKAMTVVQDSIVSKE